MIINKQTTKKKKKKPTSVVFPRRKPSDVDTTNDVRIICIILYARGVVVGRADGRTENTARGQIRDDPPPRTAYVLCYSNVLRLHNIVLNKACAV